MKVMVTGATGMVGQRILHQLLQSDCEIVILGRSSQRAQDVVVENFGKQCLKQISFLQWSEIVSLSWEQIASIHGVIHLAGENIAQKRWSEQRKKALLSSRKDTTQTLVDKILSAKKQALDRGSPFHMKAFISTSAVGIYCEQGIVYDDEKTILAQVDKYSDNNFLQDICLQWEEPLLQLSSSMRVCAIRVGIVLDSTGGALAKMLLPFKLGAGAVLGDGRQMMSWIHWKDLVNLYLWALNNKNVTGVIHGTAPHPVSNQQFSETLARKLKRPLIFQGPLLSAPAPILKLGLGEMSQVLLQGQNVIPRKSLRLGFRYEFETLQDALSQLLTTND